MNNRINYCNIDGCNSRCVGRGWCRMHYQRWVRHGDPLATPRFVPLDIRFWRYVDKTDDCWLWTGAVCRGYGHFCISQRPTKTMKAHRFAYELITGPIPDGLTIDHLCRNPLCVNPDHLEPVTISENRSRVPRKTHCKHGHAFTEANTHISESVKRGKRRRCRTCARLETQRYRAAKQSKSPS